MVVSLLTSTALAGAAQNTIVQMTTEGLLKTAARPAFILADKHAKPEARKYTALREFLIQGISVGLYFAAIQPLNKFMYKVMRKIHKGKNGFEKKDLNAFKHAVKRADEKHLFAEALKHKREGKVPAQEILDLMQAAGKMEAVKIAASCIIIAALLPQGLNYIIHPIMHFIDKHILKKDKK